MNNLLFFASYDKEAIKEDVQKSKLPVTPSVDNPHSDDDYEEEDENAEDYEEYKHRKSASPLSSQLPSELLSLQSATNPAVAVPRDEKLKKRKRKREKVPDKESVTTTKCLYVGGLPFTATEADIRSFFNMYGSITEVTNRWGYVPDNGKYKGIALVTFDKSSSVNAAIGKNGEQLKGRTITVKPSTKGPKKAKKAMGARTLFVGNLPFFNAADTERKNEILSKIQELFRPCGKILSIRLPMDDSGLRSTGFGFVIFQGLVQMKVAKSLNKIKLFGRTLQVGEQKTFKPNEMDAHDLSGKKSSSNMSAEELRAKRMKAGVCFDWLLHDNCKRGDHCPWAHERDGKVIRKEDGNDDDDVHKGRGRDRSGY